MELDKYGRLEDSFAAVNIWGALVRERDNGYNFWVVRKPRSTNTTARMGGLNFCWRLCLDAGLGLHLIAESE